MHKNNGAAKVFSETAIPKLPKTLSKVGIFLKLKLRINEKFNLPQMLSLTFKTLGNSKKQRFQLLSYVQISKLFKA